MVTIKDISKKLGISISSVSKALNGATDISQKTREKVIEVANEMGYIKKSSFNNLKLKFGIIIDEDLNDYNKSLIYDIILGFNKKVVSEGNEVLITTFKNKSKRICFDTIIKTNGLAAAIVITSNVSDNFKAAISKATHPIVIINNYLSIDKSNVGYVGIDVVEGIKSVVNHFIYNGHRDIAFINMKETSLMYEDKIVGYIAAITSNNISYRPDFALSISFDSYKDELINFMKEKKPTAICTDCDLTAYKVVTLLSNRGYDVPNDINVIGFDNNFLSTYSFPSISTVSYDKLELGYKAYTAIYNILNGNTINKIQIKPEVLERQSSNFLKIN